MLIIILIYLVIAVGNSMYASVLWFVKNPDAHASDGYNINWWIAMILYGLMWPGVWVMKFIDMFKKNT